MATPRNGVATPVDRLNELGNPEDVFKSPPVLQFIRTLIDIIRQQFAAMLNKDTAAAYFHLSSPNGTVYRVSVDDTGALKVENARARQIREIAGRS